MWTARLTLSPSGGQVEGCGLLEHHDRVLRTAAPQGNGAVLAKKGSENTSEMQCRTSAARKPRFTPAMSSRRTCERVQKRRKRKGMGRNEVGSEWWWNTRLVCLYRTGSVRPERLLQRVPEKCDHQCGRWTGLAQHGGLAA